MACIRLSVWIVAAAALVAFAGSGAVKVRADATTAEAPLANSTGNTVGDVTADFSSGTLQVAISSQSLRPDAKYEVCITDFATQELADQCDPLSVLNDTPTGMLEADGSGAAKGMFSFPVVPAIVFVVVTNVADPSDTLSATVNTYVTQSTDTASSS
jgi:hypothetical protein